MSSYQFFGSRDVQGTAGFKHVLDLINNSLISNLGIRTDYQYFQTQTVNTRVNTEWIVLEEHPISLDFSWVYVGILLGIGKN
ncbi:MAG: hypothetical protein MK081_10535 [Flavobacteriales bacterium]|nr:hypothetical protein [Flavobacteriales bacterium]